MNNIKPGTVLMLIRHGETEWNRNQRIQGHLDIPLSERGIRQTERLREWLGEERPHVFYSSDLTRSHRTAELMAGDAPIHLEPRVREGRFGEFQGLSLAEIESQFPEQYRLWREDSVRNRPPGGETLEELQERCMAALREHLPRHPGQRVALVAHGGPIRVMVCGVLGLPLDVYPSLRVENTSVTTLLFTARRPVLAGFNDTAHLRVSGAAPGHTGWEEK